jgi:hypothetical protein
MEKGERVVTVDELMALAVVLGVSPAALLLPLTDSPRDRVLITGAGSVPASEAWSWLSNDGPMRVTAANAEQAGLEYALYGLPSWQRRMLQLPAGRALQAVVKDVRRVLGRTGWFVEGGEDRFRELADQAERSVERLKAELERTVADQEEFARDAAARFARDAADRPGDEESRNTEGGTDG